MILLWSCFSHVLFHLSPSLLPKFGRVFGHGEQTKIIFSNQEDVEPMQSHCKWDVTKYPLQNPAVVEVRSGEYPMLGSHNLRQGLHLPIIYESWDNLCSSA
jgi:hypothetical protein